MESSYNYSLSSCKKDSISPNSCFRIFKQVTVQGNILSSARRCNITCYIIFSHSFPQLSCFVDCFPSKSRTTLLYVCTVLLPDTTNDSAKFVTNVKGKRDLKNEPKKCSCICTNINH